MSKIIAQRQVIDSNKQIINSDSLRLADIHKYYSLAKQYKDGNGVAIDYSKAFDFFSRAAALGDAQSTYAVAYMHYKGLGTAQDYTIAAQLFAQGAYEGRDNSEYFYALCLRNGYGVMQNEDSAQYWLKKAASFGYKQATQELQMKVPENSNTAVTQLIQKIHNAAIPEKVALNQFIAVQPKAPDASVIAGDYEGYVIQYDWSGQHTVSAKKLHLLLRPNNGNIATAITANNTVSFTGKWMEENADSVTIHASLQKDSLVFDNTHYQRKDHYSPNRAVTYDFRNASLNLVRKGNSVYLAGNIYMFSPDRKEPSKPLLVALSRIADVNGNNAINTQNYQNLNDSSNKKMDAHLLNVYPNPFTTYTNIEFFVNRETTVGIELYNMVGQKVFEKVAQPLNIGLYKIRIEPSLQLAAQTYVLRLVFSNGQEVIKVIKKG
ncbi:MAG: T9SS type A sorting domain-containing protein [Arachidicoccus sp.]|nr:T9SS type A sorting domain-containing protein [Arachidicoccus sp.]